MISDDLDSSSRDLEPRKKEPINRTEDNYLSPSDSKEKKKKKSNKKNRKSGSYDVTIPSDEVISSSDIPFSVDESDRRRSSALSKYYSGESGAESEASLVGSFYSVDTDVSDKDDTDNADGAPILTSVTSIASQFYSAETLFDSPIQQTDLNYSKESIDSNNSFLSTQESRRFSRSLTPRPKSSLSINDWYESSPYYQQLNETPCLSCPNISSAEGNQVVENNIYGGSKSQSNFYLESTNLEKSASTRTLTSRKDTDKMNSNEEIPAIAPEEDGEKKQKGIMSSLRKSRKTSRKLRAEKQASEGGDTIKNDENILVNDIDKQNQSNDIDQISNKSSTLPRKGSADHDTISEEKNMENNEKLSKFKSPKLSRKKTPKSQKPSKSPKSPKVSKKSKDKSNKQEIVDDEKTEPIEGEDKVEKEEKEEKEKKKSKKGFLSRKESKKTKSEEPLTPEPITISVDAEPVVNAQLSSEPVLTTDTTNKESNNTTPIKHLFKKDKSKRDAKSETAVDASININTLSPEASNNNRNKISYNSPNTLDVITKKNSKSSVDLPLVSETSFEKDNQKIKKLRSVETISNMNDESYLTTSSVKTKSVSTTLVPDENGGSPTTQEVTATKVTTVTVVSKPLPRSRANSITSSHKSFSSRESSPNRNRSLTRKNSSITRSRSATPHLPSYSSKDSSLALSQNTHALPSTSNVSNKNTPETSKTVLTRQNEEIPDARQNSKGADAYWRGSTNSQSSSPEPFSRSYGRETPEGERGRFLDSSSYLSDSWVCDHV